MCLCSGPRPDAVCNINGYDMLSYVQSVTDLGPMQGTRSQLVPDFGPMQSVPDFGPMQLVPDFGPMQGTRSQSVPDFGPMQFSGSRPDAVGKAQYVFMCYCMDVVVWGSSLSFVLTVSVLVSGTSASKGKSSG